VLCFCTFEFTSLLLPLLFEKCQTLVTFPLFVFPIVFLVFNFSRFVFSESPFPPIFLSRSFSSFAPIFPFIDFCHSPICQVDSFD